MPTPSNDSRARCMGTVQGRRSGLRCKLDGIDRGDGWIGCGFHPEEPRQGELDPEYVRVVIDRLGDLWTRAPEHLRHGIEHSIVDLRRALGEVPA